MMSQCRHDITQLGLHGGEVCIECGARDLQIIYDLRAQRDGLEAELAKAQWLIKQHQRTEKDGRAANELFKDDILGHRDRAQEAVLLLASKIAEQRCLTCPIQQNECRGTLPYGQCVDLIRAWAMNQATRRDAGDG